MEIEKLQAQIIETWNEYCDKNWLKSDKNFLLAKLMEEMGELAQAILIYEDKCRLWKRTNKEDWKFNLQREFGDVFGILMILSKEYEIDVEKCIQDKRINNISWQKRVC